jgi:hypothetical protein
MKNIFTLTLIGLVSISALAMNPGNRNNINQVHKPGETIFDVPYFKGDLSYKNALNQRMLLRQSLNNKVYKHEKAQAIRQKLDSYVYQEYDAINSVWVNNMKDEFTYNASGMNTLDVMSYWNTDNGQYELSDKVEYAYDENGYLVTEIYYSWETNTLQWVNLSKSEYSYNSEGMLTSSLSYYWDMAGSQWMIGSKNEITYNSQRNVVLDIIYYLNPVDSTWINEYKTENEYNANGSISISTYFSWNSITSLWINQLKSEYTYDSDNLLTLEVDYQWNQDSNQWVNNEKHSYSYDGNMNMIIEMYYEWNGTFWNNTEKDELTYNNAYSYNDLILPLYFGETSYLSHMLTGIVESDSDDNGASYYLYSNSIFNYSAFELTGIAENLQPNAIVYPQPASGLVTFKWNNNTGSLYLKLYAVSGKLVLTRRVENDETLSIAGLASGLYLYTLKGNSGILISGKLSVQ